MMLTNFFQKSLLLSFFLLLTLPATIFSQNCTIECPEDITLNCNDSTDPAQTGTALVSCENTCSPQPIAVWDLDACWSFTDGSNIDFSEFAPDYPATAGFTAIAGTEVSKDGGMHSCTYPRAGQPGVAMCIGSSPNTSFVANDNHALTFELTVTPNNFGKVTELSFWQLAPQNYVWTGSDDDTSNDVSGTNNYPTHYGIRILKNGTEIFREVDLNAATDWTLESFYFGNDPAFEVTGTTTFSFELTAYDRIGNGANVAAWDLDDIKIYGCSSNNAAASDFDVTYADVVEGTCPKTITRTWTATTDDNVLAERVVTNNTHCSNGITYGSWYSSLIEGVDARYNISDASLIEYANGTAVLTGTITNNTDNNIKFEVNAILSGRTFSAPTNSPKFGCTGTDIGASDWYYYTDLNGTLTGIDGVAGSLLHIERFGPAAQLGTGAHLNNPVNQFGLASWLDVEIQNQPNSGFTFSEIEHGDFNLILSGDPLTPNTQPNEATITCTQTISVLDNNASLGDKTFIDNNDNGLFDAGDDVLEGVTVNLYDASDLANPIATDITDINGMYLFTDLNPDVDYIVEFVTPFGYTSTIQTGNASDNVNNTNDAGSNGLTDVIDLNDNDNNTTVDAGFVPEDAAIGDLVFVDNNDNGIFDNGDDVLPGVTVNLYDAADLTSPIATDVTDTNGNYFFPGLDPNADYIVEFEAPQGYDATVQTGNASDDVDDNNDAGSNGLTDVIDLDPNEINTTVDAGFAPQDAKIGNYTFIDYNENGIQDNNDSPLDGVVVKLYNAVDLNTIISTTTSNTVGYYEFANLDPSDDYVVQFMMAPNGFAPTAQSGNASDGNDDDSDAGLNGFTDLIDLNPGEFDETVDAGFYPETAKIGNYTFIDNNENGIQDAGDAPLEGVVVKLYDATDLNNPIANTATDVNGYYEFANLDPSDDYVVQFMMAPNGFAPTAQSGNASDGNDDDSDAGLNGFTDLIDLNPGEFDETVDAGFTPENEKIGDLVFADFNQNGIFDAGDQPLEGVTVNLYDTNDLNNPIATAVTDANGMYMFPDLDDEVLYVVEFVTPNGHKSTVQTGAASQGQNNTSDADPNTGFTNVIDLDPNEQDNTIDAGFIPLAKLGNYVFLDTNENGIQDTNDTPLAGIRVELFETSDLLNPIADATTDANGMYMFPNLDPAKQYIVAFETAPQGFEPTTQTGEASDNNPNDSDANELTGLTDVIDLNPGEYDQTIDAGYTEVEKVNIGDFVWEDLNENGIQDDGPTGIEDVQVELLDAATNNLVATTFTNASGFYLFTDVMPGDYIVKFSSLPANYVFTGQNIGNGANDSNVKPDGETGIINVVPGQGDDLTIDAGVYFSSALPVELISFTAELKNLNEVTLTWITANELNNSHFVIERSNDGERFEAIGTVAGNGTADQVNEYKLVDDAPFFGYNYYRLKQYDFNGDFDLSDVETVIIKSENDEEVIVYPNPATDVTYVRAINPFASDVTVSVANANGQIVDVIQVAAGTNKQAIDLTSYNVGLYFITIDDGATKSVHQVLKID